MGSFSLIHWIIVAAIILLLFGRGRIADVMGDFGKGISSFKKGMAEVEREPDAAKAPPRQIQAQSTVVPPVTASAAPEPVTVTPVVTGEPVVVRTPEEEAAARNQG